MKVFSKIPFLLYSYLATEMLAPFFASFLIMNCVFFLVKLIPFLNFVLELDIQLPDFFRLFSYLFPNIFLYSIPMSAMMGITIGFARLSNDSEILALKASGISIYQILPPVIIVATLIALLTSYFSIKLIPLSEIALKQLTYQLLKEKINKGIKEQMFTEALGDVVIYVESIDKKNGEWKKVWVSDMRGVNNPVITMASTGYMKSSIKDMKISIVLNNGSLHRPNDKSAQIVQFAKYQIDIPLRPPSSKATNLKRTAFTMQELLQEADKVKENTLHKRKLYIEFHRRLVLPFGCLMLSLIGLPLGLQARPGKRAIGIQAGLAIFVLYYILFTFGKTMVEEDVLPVVFAMWAPNFIFFSLAVYWIIQIANERSLAPEWLTGLYDKFTYAFSRFIFNPLKKQIRVLRGLEEDQESSTDDLAIVQTPITIRGNAKSRVFHLPACEYYRCKNCTLEFKNIEVALDAGFDPCRFCKHLMDE